MGYRYGDLFAHKGFNFLRRLPRTVESQAKFGPFGMEERNGNPDLRYNTLM